VMSALAAVIMAATAGNLGSSTLATSSTRMDGAVGWAKMVGIAAAIMPASPWPTLASTLRRKCTRQRRQADPCSTAPLAVTRPRWASQMTSCTLKVKSPRSRRLRRNSVQNASLSLSPTPATRTLQ